MRSMRERRRWWRGRRRMRERKRERYSWQIPGLWSSVLNTLEVARCAEMTLYNNSFGFILWVVYTLCVPRDNHKTANDPGSHSYCSLPAQKPTSLSLFTTTIRRRCRRRILARTHIARVLTCDFASRCHWDLRFAMVSFEIIFRAKLSISLRPLNDYPNK